MDDLDSLSLVGPSRLLVLALVRTTLASLAGVDGDDDATGWNVADADADDVAGADFPLFNLAAWIPDDLALDVKSLDVFLCGPGGSPNRVGGRRESVPNRLELRVKFRTVSRFST